MSTLILSEADERRLLASSTTGPPLGGTDKSGVEIISTPAGAAIAHFAYLTPAGAVKYVDEQLPVTAPYVPPAGAPIVDCIALGPTGTPIGSWAGRLTTFPPVPPAHGTIIGVNGATGWGPEIAGKILAAGIRSERLTFAPGSTAMENCATPAASKALGFSQQTVIIGNIEDGAPLSSINLATYLPTCLAQAQLAVAAGCTMLEHGNELYLKAGLREPVRAAQVYVALRQYLREHGITLPLGFGSFGGANWLPAAAAGAPAVKEADALVIHDYGKAGSLFWENSAGADAIKVQQAEAQRLGFVNANRWWITEAGIKFTPGVTDLDTEPTEAAQAAAIHAAYLEWTALPYVERIDYYQVHDDGTGHFGLVNSPFTPRPAFGVVASFA